MSIDKRNPTNPTVTESSGVSGGSSFSSGQSSSTNFRDPASVWGAQSPFLQSLYGGAQELAGNFGGQQAAAQDIYGQATQGFNSLMNPGVNPQLQAYSGDVQRNLERNLLPTIGGEAAGFGQYGGARQGIAEGLAVSDSNQQITDMAANLYGQDRNRQMQTLQMAPGLANFGMGIPWYAANQYSGILGSPTVLSGAAGGQSSSVNAGGSSSFGSTESTSTGGGGGGGFGVGLPFL